jgi:hypothetical protein
MDLKDITALAGLVFSLIACLIGAYNLIKQVRLEAHLLDRPLFRERWKNYLNRIRSAIVKLEDWQFRDRCGYQGGRSRRDRTTDGGR